jgi:hypothetical protein
MTKQSQPVNLDDLNKHPGKRLMGMLLVYGSTKDILSMNGYEVLRFTKEIESGRYSKIALDPSRRLEYRDYQNHLIRYFHNFLAGAKTVVEHTRNMMRSADISEEHRTAYQAQVEAIFLDSLPKFIEDFRNYIMHSGLPNLVHLCSLPNERWEVVIDMARLRAWDGWTARSRQFINSQPDHIRLYALVEIYLDKTKTLHEWLVKSFEIYYGKTMKEYDALQARLHKQ